MILAVGALIAVYLVVAGSHAPSTAASSTVAATSGSAPGDDANSNESNGIKVSGGASSTTSSAKRPGGVGPGPATKATSGTVPPTINAGGSASSDDGFAWLPFGPAAPSSPPPFQWYGELERGQCSGTGSGVWAALIAVCRAAINGDQTQWAVAANTDMSGGSGGPGDCLAQAGRTTVHRALTWHQRHPDARPIVRMAAPGEPTACEFRITSVTLAASASWPTCATPLSGPLQGPVTGNTLLILNVMALDGDVKVLVAGQPATIVCPNLDMIAILTPPVDHAQTATIQLSNIAGEITAPVEFAYTQPTPSSSGPA